MNEQPLFRVGPIYKQQDGRLVRLKIFGFGGMFGRPAATAVDVHDALRCHGARFLDDGRYCYEAQREIYGCHLVPGELNEQGEPIATAASLGALLRQAMSKPPAYVGVDLATETKRAPLPGWDAGGRKRTEFDPHRGWFTDSETGEVSHVAHIGRDPYISATPRHAVHKG